MKKIILFVMAAAVFSACQESLEDRCEREAKEYTRKNCPAMIAEEIMMDSMTFDKATHTIHYHYKLMGNSDQAGAYKKDEVRQLLKDALKNTMSVQVYKDEGYKFQYTYRSEKDPQVIWFDVVLTNKDY